MIGGPGRCRGRFFPTTPPLARTEAQPGMPFFALVCWLCLCFCVGRAARASRHGQDVPRRGDQGTLPSTTLEA
ncbi:hypothetical protein BDP55DRAFT_657053, partial [Colletotrichum godetiae]